MAKFIVKMNSIAILVLAAGKSSRMKGIKQLLKIDNKTLLEHTLEEAKKVNSKNVFCVLGANATKIKAQTSTKNINYIFNENFEKGLSSSIVSGVNYIEKKHPNINSILILLADQPEVNDFYLNKLIATFKKNNEKIIASNYGEMNGVPAIFPKNYFSKLQFLKGDKGAKELLNNNDLDVLVFPRKKSFVDIDTQEDYQSYIK